MRLNSQIVGRHGPRPEPAELQYVVGKVIADIDKRQRDALVEQFVTALAHNDFTSVVTADDEWRTGCANFLNRYVRFLNLPYPPITEDQLLELAEEYHKAILSR